MTIMDNQVFMPDLLGKTQEEAASELEAQSLTLNCNRGRVF